MATAAALASFFIAARAFSERRALFVGADPRDFAAEQWVSNDQGEYFWALDQTHADQTAYVEDGSGYGAALHTKAEHGCTMFIAKEAPK